MTKRAGRWQPPLHGRASSSSLLDVEAARLLNGARQFVEELLERLVGRHVNAVETVNTPTETNY